MLRSNVPFLTLYVWLDNVRWCNVSRIVSHFLQANIATLLHTCRKNLLPSPRICIITSLVLQIGTWCYLSVRYRKNGEISITRLSHQAGFFISGVITWIITVATLLYVIRNQIRHIDICLQSVNNRTLI